MSAALVAVPCAVLSTDIRTVGTCVELLDGIKFRHIQCQLRTPALLGVRLLQPRLVARLRTWTISCEPPGKVLGQAPLLICIASLQEEILEETAGLDGPLHPPAHPQETPKPRMPTPGRLAGATCSPHKSQTPSSTKTAVRAAALEAAWQLLLTRLALSRQQQMLKLKQQVTYHRHLTTQCNSYLKCPYQGAVFNAQVDP